MANPLPTSTSTSTSTSPATARQDTSFLPTRWTVVLQACEWSASTRPSAQAEQAMAQLCSTYWFPLYAYVRRCGHDARTAEDLTQGFFTRLLEKQFLADVDPAKGQFRHFLLAAMKHFLANQRDRAEAKKRGGGQTHLSLDWHAADARYGLEPSHDQTPEKSFQRQWALAVLQRVLDQLQAEFAAAGRQRAFQELEPLLSGPDPQQSYQEIAQRLGTTEGTVKVMVYRLRRRYRQLLYQEIGQTVAEAANIEQEIRDLIAAVSQ